MKREVPCTFLLWVVGPATESDVTTFVLAKNSSQGIDVQEPME